MNLNSIVVLLCPLLNFRLHSTLSTSIDQTSQLWALHPTRLQSTLKHFTRPDYSHLWNTSPDQTTVNYEHRNIYTCISTICLFRYTFCIHTITRKPTKHTIQQMHKLKLKNNPFTPKDLIICRVTCSWDLSVSKFCRPVFRGELYKKIYFWTWQFRRCSEHKGTSI